MYGRKRMAKFRPNSEIIGKFQKLKKFYSHFVGAYDFTPLWPTAINDMCARGSDDDTVTLERPMNYGA